MKDKAEMTKEELIALGWIKRPSDKMQEKAEKQLTALEWLINEITSIDWQDPYWKIKLEQAKEMEKENIKQTWKESRKIKSECSNWNCIGDEKFHESFEKYYNETFKSE